MRQPNKKRTIQPSFCAFVYFARALRCACLHESLTRASLINQCLKLNSVIKDPASIRGKIAVVKLDSDSWYCFHYMYEVRKLFSRWSESG
jgi:hypothetical protein